MLGANKNEILNDVLKYLRANSRKPTNRNSAYSSSDTYPKIYSPLIQEKIKKLKQSSKDFVSDQVGVSAAPVESATSTQSQADSYVTFDEFVKAAEIVLENRKQLKQAKEVRIPHQSQSYSNRNSSGNCDAATITSNNLTSSSYAGVSSSLNNLKKSLSSTVSLNSYSPTHSTDATSKMDQMRQNSQNRGRFLFLLFLANLTN